MFPKTVKFDLYERPNAFEARGKEWALNASMDDMSSWTIYTWSNKPTAAQVANVKEIILRSFEVYRANVKLPDGRLEVVE